MNALSKLAVLEPVLALVIGGALLGLALWLSWREPTLVLLIALAGLALRPQLLWGGPAVDSAWGLSQSLVVFGLALNALRHGVRRTINWPVLALILVLGLNLAFGDLNPRLTLPFMLGSLAVLALPFAFTQVMLAPGSRGTYATVIMLTPLLSVVLAVLLDVAGIRSLSLLGWSRYARFEGATGNAAVFAMLGFSGLVVALHESSRPGRWYAGPLAALNFALVVLTITRMAVLASSVFALVYALLSPDLRARWRAHRTRSLLILAVAIGALVLCWQTVEGRMFAGPDGDLNMSGRQDLWPFYYREFLLSPIVGRGIGAGFVAAADWLPGLTAPHNEYLHVLVNGGVIGFILIAGAIVLWYRQLLQQAAPGDRPCLLALIPAIALYGITDNPSFYTSALPIYAYLGVLLTRSPLAAPRPGSRALATVPDARPGSDDPAGDRRIRQALARMRATSEAIDRVTSRRSR